MVGSLIEHAARALCAHEGLPENTIREGRPLWMSFIQEARAVVAAMRKPTAEMLAAGRTEIVKVEEEGYRQSARVIAECTFVAMIDAALSEAHE